MCFLVFGPEGSCERLSCDVLFWLAESMSYPASLLYSTLMIDYLVVCSLTASLLIASGHHIHIIVHKHLFTNVWTFCVMNVMNVVVRNVSDPYISRALTF